MSMMSTDEDTELRDLVAKSLESNGVLGKIRAQLRASVFLALEEQEVDQHKKPFINQELKKFLSTKEGRQVTGLVREFLEFFNLEFTLAVFDPESCIGDNYMGRDSLARELNVTESDASKSLPLIAEIAKRDGDGRESPRDRTEGLTTEQLFEAKLKFQQYDQDNSGTIEKDELRDLFIDMFPDFHINMLERYVNEEFRAVDRDFSNTIDFQEFLGMYKRLFVLCKNAVSDEIEDITQQSSRSRIPVKQNGGFVDSRNKKNIADSDSRHSDSSEPQQNLSGSHRDEYYGVNLEDDPFFDDHLQLSDNSLRLPSVWNSDSPRSNTTRSYSSRKSLIPVKSSDQGSKDAQESAKPPAASAGMSSLAGLPSLTGGDESKSKNNTIRSLSKNISDLAVSDANYDEDFESSNVTPIGQTPRSARSDQNIKSIYDEEIEEVLDDISVADDILKSDNSGKDDLTTDRTVSPLDPSSAYDYIEDVLKT